MNIYELYINGEFRYSFGVYISPERVWKYVMYCLLGVRPSYLRKLPYTSIRVNELGYSCNIVQLEFRDDKGQICYVAG